jgi:hypothetical protein
MANPVDIDPVGQAGNYVFALIAAGTIAVETSILCVISRVLHNTDADLGTKIGLVVLNIASWFLILTPLLRLTHRVWTAEAGVVAIEALGILWIFASNGVRISGKRALAYSFIVNLVSYVIGVLCQ